MVGSAIWIIFKSLSRFFFWLQEVSEDRMAWRLKMMVLVITERCGAAKARILKRLLEDGIRLGASKIVRECRVLSVRDKVDCADCVPGIRTQIPVLKIT